jgi:Zn-dependent protease
MANLFIDISFKIMLFLILIISIILHELAHGYSALYFGDQTAKNAGRLTLNPLKHIDLLGTLVLPLIMILGQTRILFGWAKPVPINIDRFSRPFKHFAIVAVAGPLTNLFIAYLCSLFLKAMRLVPLHNNVNLTYLMVKVLSMFFVYAIIINVYLAIFNLIPIPPLDGSRIILNLLPLKLQIKWIKLEKYGLLIVFLLAYFGILSKIINIISKPILYFII